VFEKERSLLVDALVSEGFLRSSRVIGALGRVERHRFLPRELQGSAYVDSPLPIGFSQTISAPHMVAIMSELLDVGEGFNILEVGTGSGYQAAVLAELAPKGRIVTVERVSELADKARGLFEALGYGNIVVVAGDGTEGVPRFAPYDRVIVTAAAPKVPDALVAQLAAGGRLLVPVGERRVQTLMEVLKDADGGVRMVSHGGCVFVPLIGRDGWRD
jgi:protein-L-isoaspartate(D-aspartate) O-methyltransferase